MLRRFVIDTVTIAVCNNGGGLGYISLFCLIRAEKERETLSDMNTTNKSALTTQDEVLDKVFTIPNLISFIRLCLVPLYLFLLLCGKDIAATFVFALAASTDWVDGQIARRTHAVSKLGQLLDPAVDRILMIAGVLGLLLVGRLPLWVVVVVVLRDIFLIVGAAWLLKRHQIRIAVIYPGKVATTLLFVGFAGLLLNLPQIAGLGIVNVAWLPGFSSSCVSWGIWFVYAGLLLAILTTVYYIRAAYLRLKESKAQASVV